MVSLPSNRRLLLRTTCAVSLLSPVAPALAAQFSYKTLNDNIAAIAIGGKIESGDFDQFKAIRVDPDLKTVVMLNSPGGAAVEAMAIGEAIHRRHYDTYVPSDMTCASACGLIWLAGDTRLVGPAGRIGFHAAYTMSDDGVASESGVTNGLVGAYLTKLGLSYEAVAYITSAPPHEMRWLNPNDANEIGVAFKVLNDQSPAPATRTAPDAPTPAPAPAPVATREQSALTFIQSYFAAASGTGSDVRTLAPFYPDGVNYYGANTPRPKVMVEKRKFAERWPVRQYTVSIKSFGIQCASVCTADGIVGWDVTSQERGVRSIGTAHITFKLTGTGPFVILSENGSVMNRTTQPLAGSEASPPVASSAAPEVSQAYN